MKSLPKLAVVVSVILAFFVSGASIKLQAQDDGVRACVLESFGQAVFKHGEN
jgi:hypothetical protein